VFEHDWVVVGATPETMRALGYRQVGRDFPVFIHPETGDEYALARTERKTGPGHTGFVCHAGPDVKLEDDLRRRDLTINALARAADGHIVDPWGGQRDLAARRLRHVSAAFAEDPLRVIRVARFAAQLAPWGFVVAPETMHLMRSMCQRGELQEIAAERVWQELTKAMAAPAPSRFFATLDSCGGLAPWFAELSDRVTALDGLFASLVDGLDRFGALGWILDAVAVQALCNRLKTPRDHLRLALCIALEGRALARWPEQDSERLLDAIKAAAGLRQPDWFARVVSIVGACDTRAAPGLIDLAARIRAISPDAHRRRGLEGRALGDALRRDQIDLVRREALAAKTG